MKWKEINNIQKDFMNIIDFLINNRFGFRADVLTWDMEDKRHKDIENLDVVENLRIMVYHLCHHVLKKVKPEDGGYLSAQIFMDENGFFTSGKSNNITGSLNRIHRKIKQGYFKDLYPMNKHHVYKFKEVDSKDSRCIQIADLLAGMARSSKMYYDTYKEWKKHKRVNFSQIRKTNSPSQELMELHSEEKNEWNIKKENARFNAIYEAKQRFDKRKIGASLDSTKGFQTRNPNLKRASINFWLFKDSKGRAPTK